MREVIQFLVMLSWHVSHYLTVFMIVSFLCIHMLYVNGILLTVFAVSCDDLWPQSLRNRSGKHTFENYTVNTNTKMISTMPFYNFAVPDLSIVQDMQE